MPREKKEKNRGGLVWVNYGYLASTDSEEKKRPRGEGLPSAIRGREKEIAAWVL